MAICYVHTAGLNVQSRFCDPILLCGCLNLHVIAFRFQCEESMALKWTTYGPYAVFTELNMDLAGSRHPA